MAWCFGLDKVSVFARWQSRLSLEEGGEARPVQTPSRVIAAGAANTCPLPWAVGPTR